MTLIVKGERELSRAFAKAAPEARRRFRKALRDNVGKPIAKDAQTLAEEKISGLARGKKRPSWSKFRVGITQTLVYVAPVQRGVKGRGDLPERRPKFAGLMLDEAMEPALEKNEAHTIEAFGHVLDDVARYWEAV